MCFWQLNKKRSSFVGAFVSTHGRSIDDVDKSILEAKTALSEVTKDLTERSQRWRQVLSSCPYKVFNLVHLYSRVPIRRGVRNKRSGTQDEKCIGRNISHMCLGLFSRCRFILTNLYLKVLHFDILIQLKDTAHFLGNVLGLIKGVCRINVPHICLSFDWNTRVYNILFPLPSCIYN